MISLEQFINSLNNLIEVGGIYVYPLLFINVALWYMLGYRFHTLRRGNSLPISKIVEKVQSGENLKPKGIIDGAIYTIIKRLENIKQKSDKALENVIDEVIFDYHVNLKTYFNLIKALTISAPILGLLGTVDGMITMFNSLVSGAFYSLGGGIAGGISKALYTTELGLIIGIPGLVIGNLLNSKQKKLEEELLEVRYFLLEKFKKEVNNEKV